MPFDPSTAVPVKPRFDPSTAELAASSPYSPESVAAERQALVQSQAGLARRRAEAEEPRYRIGFQPYGMDEPLLSVPIPASLAAFGSEAAKSIVPTGAGVAAASAITPYSNAVANVLGAAPGLGRLAAPVVRFGAPLVAGGAGAIISRLGEDAVLPQILPEDAARGYDLGGQLAAENPTAAMLGQFAGAGPFFRPGLPVNSGGGARIAVPAITGAVGAGIEGANQIAQGDFDVGRLATATLGSALLNRETRLGQRIAPNLVLPNSATSLVPEELGRMGQVLREPVLPEPTAVAADELAGTAAARGDVLADEAGTQSEAARLRLQRLGQRMMGINDPGQKLQILDQEMKLAGDALTVAEQRAGLDYKLELKRQIDAQKALEDAARQEQKAIADAEKAAADAAKAKGEAVQAANEPPKSEQILAETGKPKSIANIATEIGTQTSPYALQEKLNGLTQAPPPALETPTSLVGEGVSPAGGPVSPKAARVGTEEILNNRELPDVVAEMILRAKNTREAIRTYIQNKPEGRALVEGLNEDELGAWLDRTAAKFDRMKARIQDTPAGPRDPTVSTGDGVPTAKEQVMLKEQQRLVDEYLGKGGAPDTDLRKLVGEFDAGGQVTVTNFADAIEGMGDDAPKWLSDAANKFRQEVDQDFDEFGGRGDAGDYTDALEKAARRYLKQTGQKPTTVAKPTKSAPAAKIDVSPITSAKTELEMATIGGKMMREEGSREGMAAIQKAMQQWKAPAATAPRPSAEQRLNDADITLPPLSSLTRAQKRAELDAAGVTTYNGKRLDDINPAELSAAVGKLRRGQLEAGFTTPGVVGTLGGGGAGAVAGFAATDKEPGESDEEFQARRLRNTALGAAVGAGAGAGLGALQRGAQQSAQRKRAPISRATDLPTPGEGQGVRETAAKVIENRQYPERLRQTLADDPDIIYDKFALSDLADRVSGASIPELQAMQASPNIRERLGATAELANRYSLSADPAEQELGANLYSELAQNLTSPAQMLGLGKLVKTPQGYVTAVSETLKNVGRTLSKPQADALNKLAVESIKAEQELARASRLAEEDFSAVNEAAYRQAQRTHGAAQKNLDDFVHQVAPEGWDDLLSKTIQGNLLTPLSLVANVFGNTVYQPVRRASSAIASAIDEIYSAGTGKPRTMSRLNPLPSAAELRAAADGVKIAAKELITGPGVDSYVKAEVQRGFRPMRSLVQAWSGENLAVQPDGTVALNDRAKKLYEGLAGIAPEAMFRFLNLGDKPFRRAAEVEILTEQARLRGLKGRDLARFLEFPDKATQELLATEGRRAIFAQENKGVTKLNQFLDSGLAEMLRIDHIPVAKGAAKVFNRIIVPFRQFPVNYVLTALNFAAPELAISKSIYYGSKGDRRKALQNLGEGALGVMMYGGANYLWDKGLISEPTDKDAKARSTQYEQMGPQRINLSGLNRALDGGDASYKLGDLTMDWGRLGIPASVFYVFTLDAAGRRKDTARTGEDSKAKFSPTSLVADRISSYPGMASFSLDQSWLSGTASFLEALRNPDPEGQEMQNWAANAFRAASSIAVPNSVEALARAQYEYIPDLKGDNLTETLKNTWDFKTMQLPAGDRAILKRDLWGEPIRRTQPGENPYINQFVDVTRTERKPANQFKQRLIDLYKQTESPDVYPSIPTRNLSIEGVTVKLDPQDYENLQAMVGSSRRQFAQMIAENPMFLESKTLPEAKILALQEAYSEGAKIGRQTFLAQPGILKKYFPDLVGAPLPSAEDSRTVARDPKARARMKLQQPVEIQAVGP
jgi:hypothetical protein